MSGFTKLVPEIIQSSIWNEPSDIRIVWITMLATKDAEGYVRGDAKTIARLANVSEAATTDALRRFQEPDPSSHTPDNDGRRIAPAPGGWIVLNHHLYRTGDRNEYMKDYMRQYRARKQGVSSVNTNDNIPSASVSVSASKKEGMQGEKDFEAFWKEYPKKKGKIAAAKAWKNATTKPDVTTILAAVRKQKTWTDWIKDRGQFIPLPATWLNQGRWDDERTVVQNQDGNI